MKTVKEFADEYKVSEPTVRRWIKSGEVKAIKIGRVVRIVSANVTDLETEKKETIAVRKRPISREAVAATYARFGR